MYVCMYRYSPIFTDIYRLPESRVLELVTQVAKGIEHIHSRRMLHRDIKVRQY
jgi:serine/threonine protein kinase